MAKASELVQSWFRSLEDKSPINLCLMTQPLSESIVGRLNTLEKLYGRFILYRFLNRKIHPVLLLVVVSSGLTYLGARVYRQSTKLVLTLVGVIYPLCRSWKLIRQQDKEEDQY
ncbi:hypothetical protein G6F56_005766 [Rhizopus delemar]|nr:hypothetical protein G6F56_005766 [Rhizopus delemar]